LEDEVDAEKADERVKTDERLLEAITMAREDVKEARRVLARGIFTLEVLVEHAGAYLDKADLRLPTEKAPTP
jgi:peptide subunit release factor 1 (eRF1)